jgi:tetratricopeptide (TPR) repeat protein
MASRIRMRTLLAILVASTCAVRAHADSDGVEARARAHFRAGKALFETGDYERAIDELAAAYQLAPLPDILFNLGQAHRLKGDKKIAADYYRRYVVAKPSGMVSDQARRRLAELEAEWPAATAPPAPPSLAPPRALIVAARAPLVEKRAPAPRRSKRWLWLPLTAGAAAIAVGVGLGVGLTRDRDPMPSFGVLVLK